ncbi:hypothetical protein M0804_004886 [Polistes exclamans]|nr:hypothetical protein M0804_004886 [Polistes exclamans]
MFGMGVTRSDNYFTLPPRPPGPPYNAVIPSHPVSTLLIGRRLQLPKEQAASSDRLYGNDNGRGIFYFVPWLTRKYCKLVQDAERLLGLKNIFCPCAQRSLELRSSILCDIIDAIKLSGENR